MVKQINISDDPISDLSTDVLWVVTDYHRGCWEGDGIAYAEGYKDQKNKFFTLNLGHCSCYGPGERSGWELIGDITDLRTHIMGNQKLIDAIKTFREDV